MKTSQLWNMYMYIIRISWFATLWQPKYKWFLSNKLCVSIDVSSNSCCGYRPSKSIEAPRSKDTSGFNETSLETAVNLNSCRIFGFAVWQFWYRFYITYNYSYLYVFLYWWNFLYRIFYHFTMDIDDPDSISLDTFFTWKVES